MSNTLGHACNYDELQPILRARAEELKRSRDELDRITGLPKGFCAKVLADPPLRRLGPDTIGPMLWGLGVKLAVLDDPRAREMFTDHGELRDERYAQNAMKRLPNAKRLSVDIQNKILSDVARMRGSRGGHARMTALTAEQRKRVAKMGARARWRKKKDA